MKPKTQRSVLGLVLFGCLVFALACFAPPFSELQSAKLAGKGRIEVTPSFSSVSFSGEQETNHVQNHYGFQAGFGLSRFFDIRARYERIQFDTNGGESSGVNVVGFGPKFGILKDWLALYLPVGFAFGQDLEVSKTWQFHPTLLFTIPINKNFEFNTSAKALIPLSKDGGDTLVAFNLGAGVSADLDRWAIRPEIGFLYDPSGQGHYMHLSIGFNYRFK